MTTRKDFIQQAGIVAAVAVAKPSKLFASGKYEFESKRPPIAQRHFTSEGVEEMIRKIMAGVNNPELT